MDTKAHSDVTTEGIRVQAAAELLEDHSDPDRLDWRYGYRITLTNVGDVRARLLSRHWVIVDSRGERREVRGEGVVGENPDLRPGESFGYQSLCPLRTEWGTMEGSYRFAREDGSEFVVRVGRFFLVPSNPPVLQR
jgi:ApaG protein